MPKFEGGHMNISVFPIIRILIIFMDKIWKFFAKYKKICDLNALVLKQAQIIPITDLNYTYIHILILRNI